MRRVRGAIPSPLCIADKSQWIGSIIVGPGAEAKLLWLEGRYLNLLSLKPKQIVADVKKLGIIGKPLALVVVPSTKDNGLGLPNGAPMPTRDIAQAAAHVSLFKAAHVPQIAFAMSHSK
jgi:hypothetical protein